MDSFMILIWTFSIFIVIAIVLYILRSKSLFKGTPGKNETLNFSDYDINYWLNDALSWIFLKNDRRALFVPAWLESLNDFSLNLVNDVAIHFEAIEKSDAPPKTKKISVETKKGSENLKLIVELKLQSLSFRIAVKQKNDINSSPVSLIVFAPFIEGTVTVSVNYKKEPAAIEVAFSSPPNMELTLNSLETNVIPFDRDKILIPLLKQIISSSIISIPLVVSDLGVWQPLSSGTVVNPEMKHNRIRRRSLMAVRSFDLTKFDSLAVQNLTLFCAPNHKLGNLCCVVSMTTPKQKMCTSTLSGDSETQLHWLEEFQLKLDALSTEICFELLDQSRPDQEKVLGMALLAFDDITTVQSQQHLLRVVSYDNKSTAMTLSLWLSLQAKSTMLLAPVVEQNEIPSKPESISPKRRIRTVKRVGADGTTVTATTVTTEKPASAIYDNLLPQTPMQVEKVEEEEEERAMADDDVPRIVESHKPQMPGVTELVVHDLMMRPSSVLPHKSTNQHRLAYTITVTGVQKEPLHSCDEEIGDECDVDSRANTTFDTSANKLVLSNNKRPIKLVRTLKKHFSFSRKHHMVITRRHSLSANDVRPGSSDHDDFYQYQLPDEECIAYAGNSATKKTKKKGIASVSSSFRNLFRKKSSQEKSSSSGHDVTETSLVKSNVGAASEGSTTTGVQEYQSATFPRQKKKSNVN